ncbi:MAG TPA: cyclic nucleotide-binding domain-containing protein [Novimethylophilus sp.]|jgi:CRP-like cAMP-binding protein|uniref:Crp/Fnr family transcriptional regulator n=1 Tax=Novimethylophilus sp. TaxID=2137426 RepID=UPI002F4009E2
MAMIPTNGGQPAAIDGLDLIGAGTSFRNELFDMVANSAIFNRFEGPEIRQLIGYMHAYSAPAGTTLFREGEPGKYMGILIEGSIEVRKQNDDGREHAIATITPGKTFGEMSLIDGLQHSASGVTLEPIVLTLLGKEPLRQFLEKHPASGVKMLWEIARLLSLRLRQTSGQLVDYLNQ